MDLGNVVKSLFLGLGIGGVVLLLAPESGTVWMRVLSVLASGGIGLLVGLVTEWLTSLLPLRMARPRTYFLINGAIAVAVTAAIMVTLAALSGWATDGLWGLVGVVLAIVVIANIVDYLLHRQRMTRLRRLQDELERERPEDT